MESTYSIIGHIDAKSVLEMIDYFDEFLILKSREKITNVDRSNVMVTSCLQANDEVTTLNPMPSNSAL